MAALFPMLTLYGSISSMSKSGVAVEKLFRPKIAKNKLRQDAL